MLFLVAACSEPVDTVDEPLITPVLPIESVIGCATSGGLPASGTDLQVYRIPGSIYTDAKCNDDSDSILYFRPGRGAGLSHWLIELEGGGACRTAQECADRFCQMQAFNSAGHEHMSSNEYLAQRQSIAATGVQSLTQGPFEDYNHVFIHYCSSDIWSGTAVTQIGTASAPPDHTTDVTFSTRFAGDAILRAAIRVLRRDGVPPLVFTLDGASLTLPDLDDATGNVILAGGSAGGFGVIRQLDRVVADLVANHNPNRTRPFYAGFIDSAFPPTVEGLGFQFTDPCTQGSACTWKGYVEGTDSYYSHVTDDSCLTSHPIPSWKCNDTTHVIRNHITTPIFIRQGETDALLSKIYREKNLLATDPSATMTMPVGDFETLVRAQAGTIAYWSTSSEEVPLAPPGGFVPDCPKHDPLHDDAAFFTTTIDGLTWGQVWQAWISRTTPRLLVGDASLGFTSVCN